MIESMALSPLSSAKQQQTEKTNKQTNTTKQKVQDTQNCSHIKSMYCKPAKWKII